MSIELITILFLFISFFALLAYGVPVAYSIGISTTLAILINIATLPAITTVAQRMTTGIDSFALLAIPFFVLAGELMNSGGIANRLINFAKAMVGSLPGGLATLSSKPTCQGYCFLTTTISKEEGYRRCELLL